LDEVEEQEKEITGQEGELRRTRRETCHKTKGMPDERFDHIISYHITYETLIRMSNWKKKRALLMTM
jgi:hypothetical protein